ncbi:MAG: hypothetical protein ABIR92_01250 [Gemmatimonadaceae bacterium]
MRSSFLVLSCLSTLALVAEGQDDLRRPIRREPRAYFVISDGLGIGSGGALGSSTGLAQMMRAGAAVRLAGSHGLDVSAVRVQMVVPANTRFTDPDFNDPSGDALILSYGTFGQRRGGGFPSVFTIGGGVMRRRIGDLSARRDFWAVRAGYDAESLIAPTRWMDVNASFHLLVTPGREQSKMYVAAFSLGIRIG